MSSIITRLLNSPRLAEYVELLGAFGAIAGSFFLPAFARVPVWALLGIYLVLRLVPASAKLLNAITSWADVPNWPEYVCLCLVALLSTAAATEPLRIGMLVSLFVLGAGRLYSALYP